MKALSNINDSGCVGEDAGAPHGSDNGGTSERQSAVELIRIIDFLEHIHRPFEEKLPGADPDPVWNIVLFLVRSHLRGELVSKSSLASVANIPFTSAMRRIQRMIDEGQIEQYGRSSTAKSFYLQPSKALLQAFHDYAMKIKLLLAETYGIGRRDGGAEDYYFGDTHVIDQFLPPLKTMTSYAKATRDLRFLLHDDNYFESMRNMWADFRTKLSSRKNFVMRDLQRLHDELFANGLRKESAYDVVCVNMPWLGEAIKADILQPLDPFLASGNMDPNDFHPNIWTTGQWGSKQYGVPIYCTLETLAIRSDLFEEHGLEVPSTFESVLDAGRRLHQPKRGTAGIVWNAARGMPVASSFMFFMSCCGQPVINVPTFDMAIDYSEIGGEMYRPKVLGEQGRRALDYMRRLLAISPPDILSMDWERSLNHFMSGQSAMIYCWTMRAARFELDIRSMVKRRVKYLPHPHCPGIRAVDPIGGFLLAIPKRLSPERSKQAFEAISWMASPMAMKHHVKNGIPVVPYFSGVSAPEAASSIIRFAEKAARRSNLNSWPRPPIPEYAAIERILGEEIFAALSGERSEREALERSQNQIDKVMREVGRY